MELDDLVLISIDDHIIEPGDTFEGRLPAKYQHRAPRLVRREDGTDAWYFEDQAYVTSTNGAVAGRVPEEFGMDPTNYDQMRRGAWDVHERVRDMSACGVLASACFPSFPRFAGQVFSWAKDKDLAMHVIRAYNDWQIEGWCGEYPDRLIAIGIVPLWDPALAATEVRRLASNGCHAITFSENPAKLGFPSVYDVDHWHPLWSACTEEGTVVCMHIGSSSALLPVPDDAPVDTIFTITPLNSALAAADLLFSPVLRTYGPLKFALSEGGSGWVPWLLERADFTYRQQRTWTGMDFGDRLPSEVFREHIITCFIHDSVGVELRARINIDNICWEFDYPHSDCPWPDAAERAYAYLAEIPDEDINKITHENAMRHFQFDPFTTRSKEKCTVGQLRSEAADVDLTPLSFGAGNASGTSSSLLTGALGPR